MDTAATLSFFQNFYTDASLYVVPEPAGVAAPTVLLNPAPPAPVAAPAATAPVETPPVAPAPQPLTAPTAATAAPRPAAAATPVPPAVALPAPVAPQAAPPTPPVPATPEPSRQPVQPTVAELPAAAPAPPGRVQPSPTQSPVAHIPFSTLGSNPNGLLILVRLSPDEFRKLPRNVFLNNLLKAIRLIMEDVVLVNVEHPSYPVALCTLRQTMGARQFLAFGKNLLDVAVYTTQPYEPVLLFGDTAFLGAGEISMLEYDAGRKKQLWQAIQRMFMN